VFAELDDSSGPAGATGRRLRPRARVLPFATRQTRPGPGCSERVGGACSRAFAADARAPRPRRPSAHRSRLTRFETLDVVGKVFVRQLDELQQSRRCGTFFCTHAFMVCSTSPGAPLGA